MFLECKLDNLGTWFDIQLGQEIFLILQNVLPLSCACPADGYHQGLPTCVQSGRGLKLTIHFHLVLRNYNSTGPTSVKRSAQRAAYLISLCMALESFFRWHDELLIHAVSSPRSIDQ